MLRKLVVLLFALLATARSQAFTGHQKMLVKTAAYALAKLKGDPLTIKEFEEALWINVEREGFKASIVDPFESFINTIEFKGEREAVTALKIAYESYIDEQKKRGSSIADAMDRMEAAEARREAAAARAEAAQCRVDNAQMRSEMRQATREVRECAVSSCLKEVGASAAGGVTAGAAIGGVPGGLVGGALGAAFGAGVCAVECMERGNRSGGEN